MPAINFNILDGQLGQVPASIANAVVHAGICANGTPNTVYSLASNTTASATLGPGPLTENVADTISVAGACFAAPIKPSVAGSMGGVTHIGTGAGTVTLTLAPFVQIKAKITTPGALGTMQVAFSLNGGATYGAPVVSTGGAFSYLVPGTLTTLTFAVQTYTLNDVWTFNTDGTSSVAGSGTLGWITQASSPTDAYDLFVIVKTAGGLGVGQVTISTDGNGGNTTSSPILIPGGGVYVIPGTGIVATFANAFVLNDTYESVGTTAGFVGGDVTTMLTALGNSPNQFILVHIGGMGANAAAAVSLASTVDTSMTAFAAQYRYVFAAIECPDVESDATIEAAWQNFASNRIMVCCSDVLHTSSLSGKQIWRNCATPIVSRLAKTNPSVDPGWVGGGNLANVSNIRRDDRALGDAFVNNRITAVTTQPTKQGFFSTTGVMMAASGSDFASVMNRRVMDVACITTVRAVVNNINQDLLTDPRTGAIYDPEAEKIEGFIEGELGTALLAKKDATAVSASIDRNENILQTGDWTVTIGIQPKGYSHKIFVNIGFVNPGLG
jgi:hypothetical protein